MKTVTLASGTAVPVLGQGTRHLGEGRKPREEEADSLRFGIERGLTLIDTAEIYGDGRAEDVVGDAISGIRDQIFIIDKMLPCNATVSGMRRACERSLRRLRTDYIDLYMLHWRGGYPLEETVEAFESLKEAGLIRSWGVSNFDIADLEELATLAPIENIVANQVLYNPVRRGIEFDLLPWCNAHKVPLMAYSPIEQGRILNYPQLQDIALEHEATPAAIALAWILRHDTMIALPKAINKQHIEDNCKALEITLSDDNLDELDRIFPAPNYKTKLEML